MHKIFITMYKKLGQYFLVNTAILDTIAHALKLECVGTVIEIGAGHGELTVSLTRARNFPSLHPPNFSLKNGEDKISNFHIIAIEKDKILAENLEYKIKNLGIKNIKIIHGDALKILPLITTSSVLCPKPYEIVGNIPYYITGRLLRVIGELEQKPLRTVLMIQKEVAERIVAKPPKMNSLHEKPVGRMNLLAASVHYWAEPHLMAIVSKKDFKPQPKVDGAIIKLDTRHRALGAGDEKLYYQLIKILFKQPRKTILNNCLAEFGETKKTEIISRLKKADIAPSDRPQNISVEQLIALSEGGAW